MKKKPTKMDKTDLKQAHQIGGLKTQNKFIRDDIALLKKDILILFALLMLLGVLIIILASNGS